MGPLQARRSPERGNPHQPSNTSMKLKPAFGSASLPASRCVERFSAGADASGRLPGNSRGDKVRPLRQKRFKEGLLWAAS